MKKVLLSVCLLGVIAPQKTQAISCSQIASLVQNIAIGERTQKIALASAVAYYFFILKKRKPVNVKGEFLWSNLITKFGKKGYCSEELIGNFKRETETEISTVIDATTTKTINKKETIVEAYGALGTLDAKIVGKLKEFVELIKNIKSFIGFFDNPMKELGL